MDAKATKRPCAAGWFGIAAIAAWLAAGAGVVLAQAPAGDDEVPARVGRLADLGGEVYHAPADRASDWSTIGRNYPIATGDNLWVAEGGRAEIDVGAGQIRLGGATNVHVARLDDRTIALFVAEGRAILRLRVLDPGEVARIDTPNTQIALTRPGLYRVDVSQDRQRTTLVVREGEATMPTQGGMQQVLPGQTALADGLDATYVDVQNGISIDGFDSWSANRDRRYERSRSATYTSRQMVGYADLDDHGRWESDTTYGAVWYPTQVEPDWAPYRNGYWTTVPVYGYTWVDYAPWGYAPFHYGRWVHHHGRWGWCPGSYVARPRWSPAMVGWVGGTGWQLGANFGTPVYGWVPLAWGEAFRPWWSTCGNRCWDHYNRPYSVHVEERTRRAPPGQYVNINRPGGITAVERATLAGQRPVRGNLVPVAASQVAGTPVLASAPSVPRSASPHVPLVKPGTSSTPQPASTIYATTRGNAISRPAFPAPSPSTSSPGYAPPVTAVPGSVKPGSATTSSAPVSRDYRASPPQGAPSTTTSVPPPTRYGAPVQRETAQTYAPPPRSSAPASSASPAPAQPAYTAPVQRGTAQTYAPPPQRATAPQSAPQSAPPQQGLPMPPARVAPQPAPTVQQAPPPVVVHQAPPPPQQSSGSGSRGRQGEDGRAGQGDSGRGGNDPGGGGNNPGPGNKPMTR
jgi:hypothetical protein